MTSPNTPKKITKKNNATGHTGHQLTLVETPGGDRWRCDCGRLYTKKWWEFWR